MKKGQYFVSFCINILIFSVSLILFSISKLTTLLLVSQVKYPGRKENHFSCDKSLIKFGLSNDCTDSDEWSVAYTSNANAAWIWCLYLALFFPDMVKALSSGIKAIAEGHIYPTLGKLGLIIILEALQTFGMCILFFISMPKLPAVQGLLLMSNVCFIPALLASYLEWKRRQNNKWTTVALLLLASVMQIIGICLWSFWSEENDVWMFFGLILTSFQFGWQEIINRMENKKKDEARSNAKKHTRNSITATTRILTGTIFILVYFKANFDLVYVDHFRNFKLEYSQYSHLAINSPETNHTYRNCTKDYSVTEADADEENEFGYWEYDCKRGNMSYVICPEGTEYGQTSSIPCTIEGSTCCIPSSLPRNCSLTSVTEEIYFPYKVNEQLLRLEEPFEIENFYPIILVVSQIISSLFVYYISVLSIKAKSEAVGFALPAYLSNLVVILYLIYSCNGMVKSCSKMTTLERVPTSLFYNCFEQTGLDDFFEKYWIFILTLISQIILTFHVFKNNSKPLEKVKNLFVGYLFSPGIIEQSLLLKRRRFFADDKNQLKTTYTVYACATLWHETKEEMENLLRSVVGIDKFKHFSQEAGKQHNINIDESMSVDQNNDDYKFEVFLVFDNAFEDGHCNKYVKTLIDLMEKQKLQMKKPNKERFIQCQYGEKLKWILENGTEVTCLLKDNTKIRRKKRWSQLFYFLYLLDSEVFGNIDRAAIYPDKKKQRNSLNEHKNSLNERHKNSYVLALDGDSSFDAYAVKRLLDHLKRDDQIGAICGRIHPQGSGPLYLYQRFEYAIGHWLQKSTEDVLGNVLCSPGCFSMFRLYALVENYSPQSRTPIVKKFSVPTKTALDFIQHDMGEDRWLCTLLISNGWKVKYSSISDSYTACPEGFDEYFKQRRRWISSTLANQYCILRNSPRLLSRGQLTIFHIIYQIITVFSSLIGPGTVILLLMGGLEITFGVDKAWALVIAVSPVVLFVMICFFLSSKYQLLWAKLLSIFYGMIMIVVMVSTIIEAAKQPCFLSPITFSLLLAAGSFIITGMLHPTEFLSLSGGLIYYVAIPCMYILLPTYGIMNMDDESWGTREKSGENIGNSWTEKLRYILGNEVKTKENDDKEKGKDDIENEKKKSDDFNIEEIFVEAKIGEKEKDKFFEEMINKYLKPDAKEDKSDLKTKLSNLKNISSLFYIFLNAIWIIIVFRIHGANFSIDWILCETKSFKYEPKSTTPATTQSVWFNMAASPTPSSPSSSVTLSPFETEVEYLQMDVLNLIFLLMFVLVLLMQVTGMLFHRMETITHLISSREQTWEHAKDKLFASCSCGRGNRKNK